MSETDALNSDKFHNLLYDYRTCEGSWIERAKIVSNIRLYVREHFRPKTREERMEAEGVTESDIAETRSPSHYPENR